MFQRERTPIEIVFFSVYLVFLGLSFRGASKAIKPFVDRSHKSVWKWYQELGSNKGFQNAFRLKKERVKLFLMDETCVKIFGKEAYLFVLYEPFANRILGLHFAWNANSITVEIFLKDMIKKYGKHSLWTDGATWYALACESMKLDHHVYPHGGWMWEMMERQIQRLKDRTESFDDLFPCRNEGIKCRLQHVKNWINVFFLHHQPDYITFSEDIQKNLGAGLR
jgi:putative transposase